jgi:outer membrane autotransporter protein
MGQGGSVNALSSVITTVNTAFLTNTTAFVSAPGNAAPDQQGGGVWVRGVTGSAETQANSTFTITDPATAGSQRCHTKVEQDFRGFQAGHDISALNSFLSANWHVGVTAGYVEANSKDVTPGIGSLKADFQVPFAGVYAAFSRGNFFADGQARIDIYQGEVNDPTTNGIFNQRLDARGYSLTGNVGYRFDLKDNWFVEPSAGGVLSKVVVDPFDVSGTFVSSPTGLSLPGSVQIRDIDSALGRASVRVGTTITSPNGLMVAQPFFAAGVYHEFAGDISTELLGKPSVVGFPFPDIVANIATSRVGTYGQFGVGSTFQFVNTGWLGYARVDYRTGENIESISLNTGLRYQFTPAAGLESLKDAPGGLKDGPLQLVAHNWSGFYLGGSLGGLQGVEDWRYRAGRTTSPDFAGVLGGFQAGYNYQIGRIVTGIEADLGLSNARGVKSCPNEFFYSCEADVDQRGSVSARLGYAWGRTLLYAKGGWTFGDIKVGTHNNFGNTVAGYSVSHATIKEGDGWTAGGGMEFALTDRWSAKAEYMHFDLGQDTYTVDSGLLVDANTSGDLVRVGVNYHLGVDPAPYK